MVDPAPTTPVGSQHAESVAAKNGHLVLDTLECEGVPLLCSEIARWSNITPGAARRALQRLQAEGQVRQNDNGYWALVIDSEAAHNDGREDS